MQAEGGMAEGSVDMMAVGGMRWHVRGGDGCCRVQHCVMLYSDVPVTVRVEFPVLGWCEQGCCIGQHAACLLTSLSHCAEVSEFGFGVGVDSCLWSHSLACE
jgi:hypothetical protein